MVRLFSLLGDKTTHWQLSLLAELVWDRDSERQVAVGRQAAVDIQLATLPGEISFLWQACVGWKWNMRRGTEWR